MPSLRTFLPPRGPEGRRGNPARTPSPRAALVVGARRAHRFPWAETALVAALSLPGCDDAQTSSCDCPGPGRFVARAPAGATFRLAGAGCTGTCEQPREAACAVFVVTSEAPATCTVSADPGVGGNGGAATTTVVFAPLTGCCKGIQPSQYQWELP